MRLALERQRLLRRMGMEKDPRDGGPVPEPFTTLHEFESAIRNIISETSQRALHRYGIRRRLRLLGRSAKGVMSLSAEQLMKVEHELSCELTEKYGLAWHVYGWKTKEEADRRSRELGEEFASRRKESGLGSLASAGMDIYGAASFHAKRMQRDISENPFATNAYLGNIQKSIESANAVMADEPQLNACAVGAMLPTILEREIQDSEVIGKLLFKSLVGCEYVTAMLGNLHDVTLQTADADKPLFLASTASPWLFGALLGISCYEATPGPALRRVRDLPMETLEHFIRQQKLMIGASSPELSSSYWTIFEHFRKQPWFKGYAEQRSRAIVKVDEPERFRLMASVISDGFNAGWSLRRASEMMKPTCNDPKQ